MCFRVVINKNGQLAFSAAQKVKIKSRWTLQLNWTLEIFWILHYPLHSSIYRKRSKYFYPNRPQMSTKRLKITLIRSRTLEVAVHKVRISIICLCTSTFRKTILTYFVEKRVNWSRIRCDLNNRKINKENWLDPRDNDSLTRIWNGSEYLQQNSYQWNPSRNSSFSPINLQEKDLYTLAQISTQLRKINLKK